MGVKTFLLMAGGTGGHIFPALAVAAALRERGHKVVWLGSEGAMETRIVPQHGIEIETLAIKGVRGNGLKRKLMLPFTLWHTIRAARSIIRKHQVDGAIGFGGFVTVPGGVAAKLCGMPLVIHEQNAVAGLSNRILSKLASHVLYAFPKAFGDENGLVGNPVRADIAALPAPEERFAERSGSLKLLVTGGSLGADIGVVANHAHFAGGQRLFAPQGEGEWAVFAVLAAVRIGLAQALPAGVVEVDFAQREQVGLLDDLACVAQKLHTVARERDAARGALKDLDA